jgi:hypothetical protein
MQLRRLLSVGSVVVLATGVALAQPKKKDDKKTPAPAAGSAAGSAAAPAGSAAPAEGSAVQPIEDAPPSDMEGRDENPDAPRGTEVKVEGPTTPVETKPAGYPVELALRPITLPANMAEVGIDPHIRVSPAEGAAALRARYGITPKIQLGLTYLVGGIYDDPATNTTKDYKFHPGKAGGLDVTVLLTNFVGVRVGLPVYLDPFAMSLALGAPMKFTFADGKVAIGGLDDLLNIALPFGAEFAPSFYSELPNAKAATDDISGSTQSRGTLRFSGYGIYQQKPNMAIIGRLGIEFDDFATKINASGHGGTTTSIHGGVSFTPKKMLDVGGTVGFDDLAEMPESFTLSGFLAVRI